MAEDFVLEKQMYSFRPSTILIIKYRIYSSSHRRNTTEDFGDLKKSIQTNKYVVVQCSQRTATVLLDACGELGTANQILRWPEVVALQVNVDPTVQQVAQRLCT